LAKPPNPNFSAMTVEHIRELLHADAPLTIHVVSGRSAPHIDFAHISQSQNYLVWTDANDSVELIRPLSIESITVEKQPAA
jgi:hypothetical protein